MSYNKIYNCWIKNENTVPTDRGNMSLYSQANSYLNQITSNNVAIGKNNTNYTLDVSGNVNIEYGLIRLNGDTTANNVTVQGDLIIYNTSLSGQLNTKASYIYVNDSIYNLFFTISGQINKTNNTFGMLTLSGYNTRLFVDEVNNILRTQIAYQTLSGYTNRLLIDDIYNKINSVSLSGYYHNNQIDSINTKISYLTLSGYTTRLFVDEVNNLLKTQIAYQTLSGYTTRLFVDEVNSLLKTQIAYQTLSGYTTRLFVDDVNNLLKTQIAYQTLSGYNTRLFVDEVNNILRTQIAYQTLSGYTNRLLIDDIYNKINSVSLSGYYHNNQIDSINTKISYLTLSGYTTRLFVDEVNNILRTQIAYQTLSGYTTRLFVDEVNNILKTQIAYQTLSGYNTRLLIDSQIYNAEYNTISGKINSLRVQKADLNYVNGNFFNLSASGVVVSTRTQFRNLFLGKSSSQPTPYALDVSGNCFFNLNTSQNLITPSIFLQPPIAGFTNPTINNPTVLFDKTSGTSQTYTYGNWSWTLNKGKLFWCFYWTLSINVLYGASPDFSYYMFNQNYTNSSYYMEYDLGVQQAGPYLLTFNSYWGGDNYNFNTKGYIRVSLTGSNTTYNYNDNLTRKLNSGVNRSYYFEKTTAGATKVRWEYIDNGSTINTYWTIFRPRLISYDTIRMLDQVGGTTGFISPSISKLTNSQIFGLTVYNNLTTQIAPYFNNVNAGNTDVLCINNNSANVANSTNNNCILIGPNTYPFIKTGSNLIGIGNFHEANLSSNRNDCKNNINIGNNHGAGIQSSIIIGNNNKAYYDISSWTIAGQGSYEVIGQCSSIIIGHGCGSSIFSDSALDAIGAGRLSVSIGSSQGEDTYYGYYNHYISYNGFNRSYGPVCAYNISIGAGALTSTMDSYNVAIGHFALNKMAGFQFTDNPLINRGAFNVALGFNSGNRAREAGSFALQYITNSVFLGANSTSTRNYITGCVAVGCNSRASRDYSTAIGADCSNNIAYSIRLGGDNIDTYISKDVYIRGNIINNDFSNLTLSGYNNFVYLDNNIYNLTISGYNNFVYLDNKINNLTISDYVNRLVSDNNYSVLNTQLSYQTLSGYTNRLLIDTKAPINNPTFTGTVGGITKSMVGLGNVDNTSDDNKPISTLTKNYIDVIAASTSIKLDLKAPINNPTFTGTVGGITKSMVGLSNVDNTSDANKPISTATQSALDAKIPYNYANLNSGVNRLDMYHDFRFYNLNFSQFYYWKHKVEGGGAYTLYNSQNNNGCFIGWGNQNWSANSDRRIKNNIVNIDIGIDIINKLRPVSFYFNSINDKKIGFIAQEVEEVIPEIVSHGGFNDSINDYIKGIELTGIIPFLVKAIQEQDKRIKDLELQINNLKNNI
jgi:hypothetical protein